MKITSIFQLLKMKQNNLRHKLKILSKTHCRQCNGKGHHKQTLFGYRVHDIEICECIEQNLEEAGTAWAIRNLNKFDGFTGLGNGNGERPSVPTDSYIFYCRACMRTYELLDNTPGITVNGERESMRGIHYHRLPSIGKEHVECPNCLHGANTVRVVMYQPNGNMFKMELTNEMEIINEGRTN